MCNFSKALEKFTVLTDEIITYYIHRNIVFIFDGAQAAPSMSFQLYSFETKSKGAEGEQGDVYTKRKQICFASLQILFDLKTSRSLHFVSLPGLKNC